MILPTPTCTRDAQPDIVVISDCHLGTATARAEQLLHYLERIEPRMLVIAGDLCDLGHYFRNNWSDLHRAVVGRILELADADTQVHYIIGNHDAPIRRFAGMLFANLHLTDRLELDLATGRTLIVHGDALDAGLGKDGILHRVAGWGYDRLARLSADYDRLRRRTGLPPVSLISSVKRRLPGVTAYIERFEQLAGEVAATEGFRAIVCGHIHAPNQRFITTAHGTVEYLNCGDWVEHCTAMEWYGDEWVLQRVPLGASSPQTPEPDTPRRASVISEAEFDGRRIFELVG